ncbi:MAG: hypothetical protein JWP71_1125, partial [Mucilaginibacter sp.]|nr:hypothetical protein [Mucilaginibacter sp.]
MAFKLLKQKRHRVTLIVFASLTVAILFLAFLVNRYWSPILADKLKDGVLNGTGGLYTVDFSDAELKVLEGKLIFYNITFKPDTTVYNKRNQQ